MTAISSAPAPPQQIALWRTAQAVGVFATVALLVGLVVKAEIALDVLWNILIPLVPASLLISPAIWRNVCPLATINMLSNRSSGRRTLTANLTPTAGLLAIVQDVAKAVRYDLPSPRMAMCSFTGHAMKRKRVSASGTCNPVQIAG